MKAGRWTLVPALLLASVAAWAQSTPAGLWKTIDDETGKEKSLMRISESGGVYTGRIDKLLDATRASDVCEKCTDERKGQPLVGLIVIRNTRQSADDKTVYEGGDITDPNNGKTYRLRLKLVDDGKALQVRGYIGPFFRTQVWQRAE